MRSWHGRPIWWRVTPVSSYAVLSSSMRSANESRPEPAQTGCSSTSTSYAIRFNWQSLGAEACEGSG